MPVGTFQPPRLRIPRVPDEDGMILITVNAVTNDLTLSYGHTTRTVAVKHRLDRSRTPAQWRGGLDRRRT